MTHDMNYFEIGTPDPEASRAFYGTPFDWNIGEPSTPARYSTRPPTAAGGSNSRPAATRHPRLLHS